MSEQKHLKETLTQEYLDATENIRHYSNLRFVILSVFFAVLGGLVLLAFGDASRDTPIMGLARGAGLMISLVFWTYEERASLMFAHFSKIAVELEKELGYKQISTRPQSNPLLPKAVHVTRVFFALLSAFWLYSLLVDIHQ